MVATKDTLQTDVDSLVNLVKRRKQISFDEASKELSIPINTVESWANFLEEEGELSINYKFTTPYLVAIDKGVEFSKEIVDQTNKKFLDIHDIFNSYQENISKEDYDSVYKNSMQLHNHIREVITLVKKDKELSNIIDSNLILERLNVFKNIINHTSFLKKKGDVDRLKSAYTQIHSDFNEIFDNLKNTFDNAINSDKNKIKEKDIETEESPEELSETENLNQEIDFKISSEDDYKKYVEMANNALENKNYILAKKIYSLIESHYKKLPEKYDKNINKLKEVLLNLNQNLNEKLSNQSLEKIEEISQKIKSFAEQVKENIQKNNFDEAEKIYKKINLLFSQLPKGYVESKISLENLIIDLHSQLIDIEKEKSIHDVEEFNLKINDSINNINVLLEKNDIKSAYKIYNEMLSYFNSLPQGFFEEKIEIQKKLSAVYEEILLYEKKIGEKEFADKLTRMNILFEEVEEFIKYGDLEEASLKIEQINKLFELLPEGFIEKKSIIENKILILSKKLFEIEQSKYSEEFNNIKKKIEHLFLSLNSYLNKDEKDLANETYREILNLFNSMPKGFLKEKTKLKSKILEIYHNLKLDSKEDKSLNENLKNKYDSLLKLIVKVHEDIHDKKFELMQEKYKEIVSLYNDLPIGFVLKKEHIKHEILKIYDLITLYTKLKDVEQKVKIKNFSNLENEFNFIFKLYDEIYEHSKEDIELFLYVKDKLNYLKSLISDSGKNEKVDSINIDDNKLNKEKEIKPLDENLYNEDYYETRDKDKFNLHEEFTQEDLDDSDFQLNEEIIHEDEKSYLENIFINLKNINISELSEEKKEYFNKILNNIEEHNFLPKEESEAFLKSFTYLYEHDSIDANLCLTKLLRSINDILNNNLDSAINDLRKIISLFTGNKNLLKLYYYTLKQKSKNLD